MEELGLIGLDWDIGQPLMPGDQPIGVQQQLVFGGQVGATLEAGVVGQLRRGLVERRQVQVCRVELADAADAQDRGARANLYAHAWEPYVWPVSGVDDLKVAPFHLLASEGRVWFDRDHLWHMGLADRLGATGDAVIAPPRWREVDLADAAACEDAALWWETLTAAGGEGMVVKPRDFVVRGKKGLIQPALKVRGREYLRIIYGPEYDAPEHLERLERLERLRERGLAGKRNLALREFALGHEGLKRFVAREPLRRVHECVFAVLALESEPIDPRL